AWKSSVVARQIGHHRPPVKWAYFSTPAGRAPIRPGFRQYAGRKPAFNGPGHLSEGFCCRVKSQCNPSFASGEVAERLNAPVLKTGIGAIRSRVRISPSPPVAFAFP